MLFATRNKAGDEATPTQPHPSSFPGMIYSFFFFILLCFNQIKQDSEGAERGVGVPEDELTCTICLDQVNRGELVRSLPCLHQVCALHILRSSTFWFLNIYIYII